MEILRTRDQSRLRHQLITALVTVRMRDATIWRSQLRAELMQLLLLLQSMVVSMTVREIFLRREIRRGLMRICRRHILREVFLATLLGDGLIGSFFEFRIKRRNNVPLQWKKEIRQVRCRRQDQEYIL